MKQLNSTRIGLGVLALAAVAGWATTATFMNKSKDLQNELKASRADVAAAAETLAAVQNNIRVLREASGTVDDARQKAAAAIAKLAELTPRIEAGQRELETLRQEIGTKTSALAALERKIDDGDSALAALSQRITVNQSTLTKVEQEVEHARVELDTALSAARQHIPTAPTTLAEPATAATLGGQPPSPEIAMTTVTASTRATGGEDVLADAKLRFETVDSNKDGKVEPIEFRIKKVQAFNLIDIDRNGYVTIDETLLMPDAFARLDGDRNGKISSLEFVSADTLHAMDADKDGVVTFDEYLKLLQSNSN